MHKWGKAVTAAVLASGLFAASFEESATAAPAQKPVTVLLDDVVMSFDDTAAEITRNYTFVPFRALAEALGITITWTEKTKTVTATSLVEGKNKTVVLQVGKTKATVDGKAVTLAAAPYMKNGRTLIPLSFFSTQFGAKVGWTASTRTVTIVSPAREMHLRGFYALKSYQERARMDDMNSVAFGWVRIDAQGEFTTEGEEYKWPEAAGSDTPEAIVGNAAAKGIDPYLMVFATDGHNELTKMLNDAALRDRSIDNIVALAKEKGFKGVLLDYEGLGLFLDPKVQQKLLNDYVERIAPKLESEGIKLSLAVPPPNSAYKGYDYPTLVKWADDLVIMSYQYHPKGTAAHTPQPNSLVNAGIESLIKSGIPADKLILGIDLSSETPQSVDDKLGLAKRYGLKGASFWRIGLYSYFGQDMINAINQSAVKLP